MSLPASEVPKHRPGKRRGGRASRFRRHLWFSFGPPLQRIELAFARLRERELVTTAS